MNSKLCFRAAEVSTGAALHQLRALAQPKADIDITSNVRERMVMAALTLPRAIRFPPSR